MRPLASGRIEHESFTRLLRAEWSKFRAGRGWIIGMVIVALVTVLPGIIIAMLSSCQGPNGSACPVAPIGPGGQAVEDRFYFVHQPLTGDGSIGVRVTSMSGIITYPPPNHDQIVSGLVPWAKAGIMVKENMEQGSAYAALMLTGSHGVRMQYNFTEDVAGRSGDVSTKPPHWLRLVRSGDALTGYESTDGANWMEVGSAHLAGLPATVEIGLFVTSPCNLTISEGACRFTQTSADFDKISLQGDIPGEWSRDDVGATPIITDWERYHRANGLVESDGTFTITGTGDIAPLGAEVGLPIERALIGTPFGLIALIIVAALFVITDSQQDRILIAKATVIGVVSFFVGLMAAIVAVLLGRQILLANGNSVLPVTLLTELRVVVGTAALLAVTAIFTLALGALLRRRILTIVIAIVMVVVPLMISAALPLDVSRWLFRLTPAAGFAIQQSIPEYPQVIGLYVPLAGYYPLAPWAGFAVLCGYAALALGLAVFRLRQQR